LLPSFGRRAKTKPDFSPLQIVIISTDSDTESAANLPTPLRPIFLRSPEREKDSSSFVLDTPATFKNFFIGESMISKGGSHLLRLENMSNPRTADLQIIIFDNVNRYFHESNISTDKEAYVGVRSITDEATNTELLDMYLIDYESKSFINLVSMGYDYMYNSSKPVIDSPGMFLNVTFKKAK
jgi:hypothetical protein